MASTYVNNLRLDEMATGDGSGTWGTTTNTNLTLIGEALGYATKAIADASTDTLTIPNGTETDSEPRAMYLKLTGGGQACTVTLAPNTSSKVWIIENVTSYTLTFTQGSGANVAILAGETKMIATDGAGSGAVVYDVLTDLNLAGTTKTAALTNAGALSNQGTVTVGVDDTGYDVKLFGATSGKYWLWDESADGVLQYSTLTVGVDDTGYDVKFFGATSGAYMLWDESADDLKLVGAAGLTVAADIDVDGTANLDVVDIDGATQADGTITVGVDDTGYDVKFFGATSGAYMLWDESADDLVLAGAAGLDIAGDIDVDGTANLDIVDIDGAVDMASTLAVADDFNVESGTFFVDVSNNNVGLGTTSPASAAGNTAGLHIKNSAPFVRLQDDTGTASDWELYAFDDKFHFYDNTNSAIEMTLDGDGNVGIGTATPNESGYGADTSVLSIQGASADNYGVLELLSPDTTSANRLGEITFGNLDGGSTVAASSRIRGTRDGADNSSALSFWTTDAGTIAVKMSIDAAGNVIIGDVALSGNSIAFQAYTNTASKFCSTFWNDGDNANRYGIVIRCGTDDNSGTNYPVTFEDGNGDGLASITANAGTVTYGTFTAYHPCIIPDADNDPSSDDNAYPYGTLLETISLSYTQKDGADTVRGILYNVQKSQSANSKKVLGAYGSSMNGGPLGETNSHQVLILGDGHILCNNSGGNIEVGDGICTSAIEGIGMKATESPSMIVGIAQEDVTFSSGSETKLVVVQYGIQQFTPWN